jgi:putative hydrolase
MICVDLHVHTFFSRCGIHTHLEILREARRLGMKGVAITDHGPALKGRLSSPFYDRLHNPIDGVRLLKGMECNLGDQAGEIDLPDTHLPHLDIVLLGIHPNTPKDKTPRHYTDMLIAAIERNPAVDIITHPNDTSYPVEFEPLAEAARDRGVALEINNSKTMLRRVGDDLTRGLIRACGRCGCRMAVCSDTHAINELGRDDAVRPLLARERFPESLLVNGSERRAYAFIDERREHKRRD